MTQQRHFYPPISQLRQLHKGCTLTLVGSDETVYTKGAFCRSTKCYILTSATGETCLHLPFKLVNAVNPP